MTFMKSALLGSAAVLAVVAGAQAADLPSKKAAPASYVKICDAYGAGFFYIPGTDTCVKLGGYVRAEYQYVPGQATYNLAYSQTGTNVYGNAANTAGAGTALFGQVTAGTAIKSSNVAGASVAAYGATFSPSTAITALTGSPVAFGTAPKYGSIIQQLSQNSAAQATTGYEVRGRIDVDARTPTALGTARTYIRLRAANTSGIRNSSIANNAVYGQSDAPTTGITIESAMVQWAGFTFGVAPENYAMMPSFMYDANPWAGFPNGMKQLAYTATFGGGFSATVALEDRKDFGYDQTAFDRVATAANIVANVRLDQAWGFAALHGMVGNNSYNSNWNNQTFVASSTSADTGFTTPAYSFVGPFSTFGAPASSATLVTGQSTSAAWAIGATVSFKLPMIAAGDQLWLTANYAHGALGALLSTGGLSNMSSASNHRLIGGLVRVDSNVIPTSSTTAGVVDGWNVAAAMTHYWAAQWRSNFTAGYVEINPPNVIDGSAGVQWGKGKLWEIAGSIIYSPAKDFDIGLEIQYANLKNNVQNWTGPALLGLNNSNWSSKLRVERSF